MRKPINLISGGLMGLVVGASSFVNGCEEPQGRYNDNQQQGRYDAGQAGLDLLQFTLGLYGVAGDGTSQQRNAAGFTSNLIGKEKRDEAIRKSGTTVNVYNGGGNGQRRQHNINKSFSTAFNYWSDDNKDGKISLDELRNSGKSFNLSKEKQITFSSRITGHKNEDLAFQLFTRRNNEWNLIAKSSNFIIPESDYLAWVEFSSDELKDIGAIGPCLVNYWAGNIPVDSYTIDFRY